MNDTFRALPPLPENAAVHAAGREAHPPLAGLVSLRF